jgi:hypothetical protein
LRAEYTLARVGSKRRRDDAARRVLDAMGERVRIVDRTSTAAWNGARSACWSTPALIRRPTDRCPWPNTTSAAV